MAQDWQKENIKAPHLNTLIELYNSQDHIMSKLIMLKESKESPDHEAEGKILNAVEWKEKYGIIPGTVNGYFFDHVDIRQVSKERFEDILSRAKRIWDDEAKLGISKSEALDIGILPAVREGGYVLIRYDGWSLACRKDAFEEAYHLYPDAWQNIYTVDNDH